MNEAEEEEEEEKGEEIQSGGGGADRPTAAVAPNTDDDDDTQTQSASEEEGNDEVKEEENTPVEREQEEHQEQAHQQDHHQQQQQQQQQQHYQEKIGIIPAHRFADNHSRKALQWLVWMEHELGHPIIHAGRGREHKIDGTRVDGYYETPTNDDDDETRRYVLQFHGCFWHGCPTCFQVNRDRKPSSANREDTIDARYERTLAMTCRLRRRGYLVSEMWECDFDRLIRCRVLPPRDLFHPVLPYRVRGKLLFALCRSCCKTFSQAACTHDNLADREFEGTWVSVNLRKAVEKRYRVTNVSKIWQYKIARYDPVTRQGGLFAEYINTFLKLKQEASGWPSDCYDDEAKERYLREYAETEGVVLDKDNIVRNPGLRSVAKLCLNSFWGKFGQRTNLPQTEVVKSCLRFMTLLTSPEHEIIDILPVNDEEIYASWRLREEAVVASPLTNVVIAAYTTAQARLKLYDCLEALDRRVLYYDTDSCIYVSTGDPNEYEPRTGNFLGDMTDELESYGNGSYIEKFVSGGPKFYAYIVRTPDERTVESSKVKGAPRVMSAEEEDNRCGSGGSAGQQWARGCVEKAERIEGAANGRK
ncbi:uncharacterized protein LOC143901589 [Temnothorax americanus]|uniref:uncharacterized protein LOC143901589 n=1 Tax=Temnothorax americanus TaxID=1964332 RepID=UPI0040681BD3